MSTNLKYFLGKRRSDLKTYCVKNSFETYEKLIAHLREIGVEFPTLEEYDSVCLEAFKLAELRRPPTPKQQASKHQLEKSVTQKRGSNKSRSRKSTTSKTTRED